MAKKQQSHMREERLVTEGYLDARLDGLKKDSNMRFDGFKKDITEGLDARLHGFKGELKEEIVEEMRGETVKILQAVDAVMTRFDATEKEEAAHTQLHERITDTFHEHDQRIGRLEARTAK